MLVGYKPDEIYSIFKKYCKQINYVSIGNVLKLIYGLIVRRKILIQGLNNGNKIEELIRKLCKAKQITNIKQIKMPLIIPSVDLHNGKVYAFTSVKTRSTYNDQTQYINDIDIGKAVRASCSYPGVFSPCKFRDTELIDGRNKRKCTMERNKTHWCRQSYKCCISRGIKKRRLYKHN